MSPSPLQLHGSTAAVHDYVVGRDGDFDTVRAALKSSSASTVLTFVTRANTHVLATLGQWLLEQRAHVASWVLRWPGPRRPGLALPRLGLVAPRVLHAAELARRGGLRVSTEGLPPCVLGPHARHRTPTPATAFATVCEGCSARPQCEGVPAEYLTAFGEDLELRALTERR